MQTPGCVSARTSQQSLVLGLSQAPSASVGLTGLIRCLRLSLPWTSDLAPFSFLPLGLALHLSNSLQSPCCCRAGSCHATAPCPGAQHPHSVPSPPPGSRPGGRTFGHHGQGYTGGFGESFLWPCWEPGPLAVPALDKWGPVGEEPTQLALMAPLAPCCK